MPKNPTFDGSTMVQEVVWHHQVSDCLLPEPILDKLLDATRRQQKPNVLTHWGRDKMADIFQTTSSNAFSWMEMYEFR